MLRLAACGAQVLHDRSVALAARYGTVLEVRSCEPESIGTRIVPEADCGGVTGVTRSHGVGGEAVRVTAIGTSLPSLAAIRAAVTGVESTVGTVLGIEEGEQRVTLLVRAEDADAALCAVHDALCL